MSTIDLEKAEKDLREWGKKTVIYALANQKDPKWARLGGDERRAKVSFDAPKEEERLWSEATEDSAGNRLLLSRIYPGLILEFVVEKCGPQKT